MTGDPDLIIDQLGTTSGATQRRIANVVIPPDTIASIGLRLNAYSTSGDVFLWETTFAFQRIGSGTPVELGAHDNGEVRLVSQAGWTADYQATANGVGVVATGSGGIVQWRATLYVFFRKASGG